MYCYYIIYFVLFNILRGSEYLVNNYYVYFVISLITGLYFKDFTKFICRHCYYGAIGENL